jgi:hypothetical protein
LQRECGLYMEWVYDKPDMDVVRFVFDTIDEQVFKLFSALLIRMSEHEVAELTSAFCTVPEQQTRSLCGFSHKEDGACRRYWLCAT